MTTPLARNSIAAATILVSAQCAQGAVGPIQGAFGNVFPTLSDQSLTLPRGSSTESYVAFDLLTRADVKIGAVGLGSGSQGSFYDLTAARLVKLTGENVAFGTDTFPTNPFTQAIESLITANGLSAGKYAIELSGTGDRVSCTPYCGDAADFRVNIQVGPAAGTPTPVPDTTITSPQGAYGNVFPTLSGQNLTAYRGTGPSIVTFNLLAQANVKLGALGLGSGSQGSFYDLTSIRLLDINGQHVKFGTDTFSTNPFTQPIEALVVADGLEPGKYALELSGYGDRISCTPYCGDAPDFTVRLQVTPAVPEPEAYALMLAGLGLLGYIARRKRPN